MKLLLVRAMQIIDSHQVLLDTMWVEGCTCMAENINVLFVLILFDEALVCFF